jgi:two-component sensor histidine kinase/CheY-like chemotaxis protein
MAMFDERRDLRLLYIDDDEVLARLVQKNLGRVGWDVAWAETGPAGLAVLEAEQFDAVALDHYMPGADGMAVLLDILRRPNAPPVVYCTASSESALAVTALKAGAADYVVKDVSGDFVALLSAALQQAVETAELRRLRDQADAEIRDARDRAEALLREVDHRVGNSLQLVSSFIGLQVRANDDEACKAALREAQRRIEAVAQVHRRLYTSADVSQVDLDDYLRGLIAQHKELVSPDGAGPTLIYQGESLRVAPDEAVSVGLLVTELITNAVKYAFEGRKPGVISVRLKCDAQSGQYALTVADDGVGLSTTPSPTGTRLGRTIINAMTQSLGGELIIEPVTTGYAVTLKAAADCGPS